MHSCIHFIPFHFISIHSIPCHFMPCHFISSIVIHVFLPSCKMFPSICPFFESTPSNQLRSTQIKIKSNRIQSKQFQWINERMNQSIHPSINQPINQWLNESINQPTNPPTNQTSSKFRVKTSNEETCNGMQYYAIVRTCMQTGNLFCRNFY